MRSAGNQMRPRRVQPGMMTLTAFVRARISEEQRALDGMTGPARRDAESRAQVHALAHCIPDEHIADGLLRCLAHRWADHPDHPGGEWAL